MHHKSSNFVVERHPVKVMKPNLYSLKLGTALLLSAIDTACSWASADEQTSNERQDEAVSSGGAYSSVATGLTVNTTTAKNSVVIAEHGISPIPTVIGKLGVDSATGGSLSEDTTKGIATSTQVTSNAHATLYSVPTASNGISVVDDMPHNSNYGDNAWPNNFQPEHDRPEAQVVANCGNSVWPSNFQPEHHCQ